MRLQIIFRSIAIGLLLQADLAQSQESTISDPSPVMTFLSHRSGDNLIYRSSPDGKDPTPIFGGPIKDIPAIDDSYTMVREPHWTKQSPNGKYFASWVYELGIPRQSYQGGQRPMLWVGDLDGTWTRIVNADCHEEFAWAPDSKKIAYSVLSTSNYRGALQNRPTSTEICVSGIDGSNMTHVLELAGKWFVLDWSPDGERLLLQKRSFGGKQEEWTSVLFEFRLADSLAAHEKEQEIFDPEWATTKAPNYLKPVPHDFNGMQTSAARYSPAGKEIAVITYLPKKMHAPNLINKERSMRLLGKINVLDLGIGESKHIVEYDDGIRGPICWSPDGTEIFFSRNLPADDNREKLRDEGIHGLSIWAVSHETRKARFITTGWSPDFPKK